MTKIQGSVATYVLWFPCNGKTGGGGGLHSFKGNHKFVHARRRLYLLQLNGGDIFRLREVDSFNKMMFDRGK